MIQTTQDYLVLNNLARAYQLKGDKPNAIKYYELTEQYGDERAKEQAKRGLQVLMNWLVGAIIRIAL